MSGMHASMIREFYADFVAGRIEEVAKQLAEDFVLTNPLPAPIPFGGRYEGKAGFLRYVEQIVGAVSIEDFVVDEVLVDADVVVVLGRERSRVLSNDRHYDMEWVHVLRLAEGRIRSLYEYNDTAAMRDAFEGGAASGRAGASA